MNTTDNSSVEYRLSLARAMREAGASFDVIAEVLRAQMQFARHIVHGEQNYHRAEERRFSRHRQDI